MTTRNKAAADAPPMEGQTAWKPTGQNAGDQGTLVRADDHELMPDPKPGTTCHEAMTGNQSNAGWKPAKARRGPDPELQAMARVDQLIAGLESDAQYRVIEWLKGRFQSRHTTSPHDPTFDRP